MKKPMLACILFCFHNFIFAENIITDFTKLQADTIQKFGSADLLYFKVNPSNADVNSIEWAAGPVNENKIYDIERGTDSIHFIAIASIPVSKNSLQNQIYNIFDNTKGIMAGSFYYRLRQENFDGDTTYSAVVCIKKNNSGKNSFTAHPKKFTEQNDLYLQSPEDKSAKLNAQRFQANS